MVLWLVAVALLAQPTPTRPPPADRPPKAATPSAPAAGHAGSLDPAHRPAGLLLGLSTKEGLQTWFIDGVRIDKLGDALAVPGNAGWLAVRLVSADDGKSHREQLYVGKPGAMPPAPPAAEEGCEQTEKVEVTFASGGWIGTDTSVGSSCEGAAHPTSSRELKLLAVGSARAEASSPPIGAILGTAADAVLPAEWEKGRKKLGDDNPDCLQEEPSPTSWTLARHRGRWAVRLLLPRTSEACRGLEGTWDFDTDVSEKIGGARPASEKQLADAGPSADAIAAPTGSFVVAVDNDSIKLFANGKEVAKALTGGAVVMTQWSLGKHVERWRREAKDALRPPQPLGD